MDMKTQLAVDQQLNDLDTWIAGHVAGVAERAHKEEPGERGYRMLGSMNGMLEVRQEILRRRMAIKGDAA